MNANLVAIFAAFGGLHQRRITGGPRNGIQEEHEGFELSIDCQSG